MPHFLLIFNFLLLLVFSGYTGGWKLFDFWWSGGAVICGALLLQNRPIRFHLLGIFLVPALCMLVIPGVWTATAFQNFGWWLTALFLMLFLPSLHEDVSIQHKFFGFLYWCGPALTLLYAVQRIWELPVHGFGFARSGEAQILLGSMACALFKPVRGYASRIAVFLILGTGMILNGSRSALVGIGILAVGYCWIRKKSIRPALFLALAALAAVGWMTRQRVDADPYAEIRPQIFLVAAQIFSENPLGSGPGTFLEESMSKGAAVTDIRLLSQYAKMINHAHNVLMQWSAEGGILGLSTVLAFMVCSWALLLGKFHQTRAASAAGGSNWPVAAAVAWVPAFAAELMLNVTESLSPLRWLGLVGILALTGEYSVVILKRSTAPFRLGLIALGAVMLWVGMNDLLARQAIWAGIDTERKGDAALALESYAEAARRRPWDVQPLLHTANLGVRLNRPDIMEPSVERAIGLDGAQGTARYHGARFYASVTPSGAGFFQKSRYLMFSLNTIQPYDGPTLLEEVGWSRTVPERVWRLRRILSLEPRAALAYDELADMALKKGEAAHAEKFSGMARRIRAFYGPDVASGLSKYSPLNRNTSLYESALIAKYGQ